MYIFNISYYIYIYVFIVVLKNLGTTNNVFLIFNFYINSLNSIYISG